MTDPQLATLLEQRRPSRADARRNFDALVDAGRVVFNESGLDASLEEIARRAGVGIGTLYRNFPTRDALIEAVYLEEVAAVAAYASELDDEPPFEAFAAWMRRFAAYGSTKKVLLDGLNRDSEVMQACRGVVNLAGAPLLTPHSAFYTPESMRDNRGFASRTAARFLRDGRLDNCVNRQFLVER